MQEPDSARPVHITAQERTHPAIRTLARACLALARDSIARSSRSGAADTSTANAPKEASQTPRQEGTHD